MSRPVDDAANRSALANDFCPLAERQGSFYTKISWQISLKSSKTPGFKTSKNKSRTLGQWDILTHDDKICINSLDGTHLITIAIR
jgi:hypothetical protein